MKKGFTLIEIIIAVAVLLIISAIIIFSGSLFNADVSIQGDVGKIASLIYKARSNTLASKGGFQYGVHFESKKAVLFQGSTYSSGASTNETSVLNSVVSITSINLIGGGSEMVFQKLTGITASPGSITLKTNYGNQMRAVNISGNGIVTVQ